MTGELIQYQTEDGVTVTRAINAPYLVEQHFVDTIGKVKQIEAVKTRAVRNGKGGRA